MSMEMTFEQLKELMETIAKNQLGGMTLEADGVKLRIDGRRAEKQVVLAAPPAAAQPAPLPVSAPVPESVPVNHSPEPAAGTMIKSPIVGTFYSAPSPDKEPYVGIGSKVNIGDVLFIIESMKLMNEVQSDCAGTVAEILVSNGQPVEYGQPILRIV